MVLGFCLDDHGVDDGNDGVRRTGVIAIRSREGGELG